jgi:hypothetical protein
MAAKHDWIIVEQADLSFHCLRCGRSAALRPPVDAEVYVATGKQFERIHRRCEVREETPP